MLVCLCWFVLARISTGVYDASSLAWNVTRSYGTTPTQTHYIDQSLRLIPLMLNAKKGTPYVGMMRPGIEPSTSQPTARRTDN